MKLIIASVALLLLLAHGAQATPTHINNQATEATPQVAEVVQPTIQSEVPTPTQETLPEPTQAEEATSTPVVSEPQPIGCEQYRSLLNQYDWNVNTILAIMKAESSCNTYAVGDNYPINGIYAPSCGLLQIRTLSSRPTCDQLKDPATNIAWGYKIYTSQGYGAWSVCKYKVACY